MLARAKPAAVVYHITGFASLMKRIFLNVEYITLPNLFANEPVLPEWVVSPLSRNHVEEMSRMLLAWLTDERQRQAAVARLSRLRDDVVRPGASGNTAEAILRRLPAESRKPVAPAA